MCSLSTDIKKRTSNIIYVLSLRFRPLEFIPRCMRYLYVQIVLGSSFGNALRSPDSDVFPSAYAAATRKNNDEPIRACDAGMQYTIAPSLIAPILLSAFRTIDTADRLSILRKCMGIRTAAAVTNSFSSTGWHSSNARRTFAIHLESSKSSPSTLPTASSAHLAPPLPCTPIPSSDTSPPATPPCELRSTPATQRF